ncbi:pyridoxal-phosphate dependent enzyme [Alteromonas sp. 5E99-2]|uniref:1-aminocyclopropane-1-carboxylate deaminase/D-cysteine desulfhydrase n=1 Tax=Alteromonas sp. 5E99-2 TaxID=2817683 RepID=UPI001A99B959|nr:pyridoxal-phosphate dependent enzyme [Alteromonas sp. 5E99-2]MBO1256363.1 pyridoxal-phosphate dependent enzyme [Alteromonas sp. 5E99-2]
MTPIPPIFSQITSPIESFSLPHWPQCAPKVWVKRDDLIHPFVSGNKWRKLKYANLHHHKKIVSIGGGYSNHLHALGYLCSQLQLPFTALVRGHYGATPTPMLNDLQNWGCHIEYIDKKLYATRDTEQFKTWLDEHHIGSHFIPEGGSTAQAVKGVSELCDEVHTQLSALPTHFITPVASGATLAGLVTGMASTTQRAIGIAVLKGKGYLEQQVQRFLPKAQENWQIQHGYVHGGYAKKSDALSDFIIQFNQHSTIPIEPVYSGKLFFAVNEMIMNKEFSSTDRLVLLHTGGIQGSR